MSREILTWSEVMACEYEPCAGERVMIDIAHRPVDAGVVKLHVLLLSRAGADDRRALFPSRTRNR